MLTADSPVKSSTPRQYADWEQIRKAYVEDTERPSFAELSTRFCIPESRLSAKSSDEGWPLLRVRRLESMLAQADTARALLSLAEGDRTLRDTVRATAITGVQLVQESLNELRGMKTATKLRALSTASFALLNVCNALKAVGIAVAVRHGKSGDDADSPGEAWVRGLAQQINLAVTVHGAEPSKVCNERPTEACA